MGVAILFRKTNNSVPFQQVIKKVASLSGETFVLSSGYFASENDAADIIIPEISNGFNGYENPSFYLIGGMFKDKEGNKKSFNNMVNYFIKNQLPPRVRIAKSGSYHAKLAFKVKDGKPLAVVVGSSNFSMPAFIGNNIYWSHECDVVIWKEELGNILEGINFEKGELMVTKAIEPTEGQMLDELWNDLIIPIDDSDLFFSKNTD